MENWGKEGPTRLATPAMKTKTTHYCPKCRVDLVPNDPTKPDTCEACETTALIYGSDAHLAALKEHEQEVLRELGIGPDTKLVLLGEMKSGTE